MQTLRTGWVSGTISATTFEDARETRPASRSRERSERLAKVGWRSALTVVALLGLVAVGAGCRTATGFESTFLNPESKPVQLNGQTVVALVISTQETTRRQGEDAIAAQITARGAKGVAAWTILPTADMQNEEKTRAALTQAGAVAVVTMEIVGRGQNATRSPNFGMTMSQASRGSFWGNYRWAWGNSWHSSPQPTSSLWVETQIHSLKPDELLWAGRSRTVNPSEVNAVFGEVAAAAALEIERAGLLKPAAAK